MRFTKAITIPVNVFSDEEMEVRKLGIESDDQGFDETENRLFWCIDSAHPEKNRPKSTVFYSSGEGYTTPVSIKEFEILINNHINQ